MAVPDTRLRRTLEMFRSHADALSRLPFSDLESLGQTAISLLTRLDYGLAVLVVTDDVGELRVLATRGVAPERLCRENRPDHLLSHLWKHFDSACVLSVETLPPQAVAAARALNLGGTLLLTPLKAPANEHEERIGFALVARPHAVAEPETDLLWVEVVATQVAAALAVRNAQRKVIETIRRFDALADEHHRTTEALRDSEERLNLLLHGSDCALWVWNIDTGALFLSPNYLEMIGTGTGAGDFEPHMRSALDSIHSDDLPRVLETLNAQLANPASPLYEFEYRVRARSGAWTWIATRCRVGVRDANGKPLRIAGVNSDITRRREAETELRRHRDLLDELVAHRTLELAEANARLELDIAERKRTEKQLQESNRQVIDALEREKRASTKLEATLKQLASASRQTEAANQAKSEFLANMSHELRTPMTAILGFADLLRDELSGTDTSGASDGHGSPAKSEEYVDTIRRNGAHLLEIINDILDLSKIEAGRFDVERIRCSPIQIIDDVRNLMQVRTRGKPVSLTARFDGPVPETIKTDPTRLRQILINLVGNAVKFTDAGEVRIITAMAASTPDDPPLLRIDIEDTGIGIAPEQVQRLFRPFSQADTSTTREFGGTGLGLAVSRRLAVMLGGDITLLRTEFGRGSTFRVTIATGALHGIAMTEPLHESNHPRTQSTPASVADEPQAPWRILLAEDGPDNQRLLSFILKKSGAQVAIAANGRIAVEKALAAQKAGQPFDVILMDIQMPVMDGYEATRTLRQRGFDGPIVALTAHAMSGDRESCLAAGCDDYATKPIDRKRIIETIRSAIQARSSTSPADPT